ncbi:MAG: regulatory signaling modulator protein AmpE [Gammaproteobacteria bacterium]|nr:regulatory signaling modulator protein AmpE [Gammaproteobacteria bacterium]
MSLISILISLAIESYWEKVDQLRRYDWFETYRNWMMEKLEDRPFYESPFGVVLVLGPLVFAVWLIDAMLGGVFSLFSFLFGIAVLLFCLGPRTLSRDVQAYVDAAETGNHELAKQYAIEILGRPVDEQPQALASAVKNSILIHANDRIIAILFWFALLGPMGAVLFRASTLLKEETVLVPDKFSHSVHDLFWVMNWVPARLCIIGYALAGNFIDTISYWRSVNDFWTRDSDDLLVTSGNGALRQDVRIDVADGESTLLINTVAHAISLIKRTIIVFLALLAAMTLAGWMI